MKIIIAGSRHLEPHPRWIGHLFFTFCGAWRNAVTTIITGGCRGVDQAAARWAKVAGLDVQVFNAKWDEEGRAAGPRRNALMIDAADGLIAVWDGKSRGTKDVISKAVAKGIPMLVQPWPLPGEND